MNENYILQCKEPAKDWMEGFPTGCGKLAAMLWGEKKDVISLNHEKLWRGVTRNRDNEKIPDGVLEQIRDLIDKKDFFRATAIANAWLGGTGGMSGIPGRIDSFQPAGELCFEIDDIGEFDGRELDLLNGVASVRRRKNTGEKITTVNYTDVCKNVMVCRWESDGTFSGVMYYTRMEDKEAEVNCTYADNEILYSCSFNGGISFKTKVRIVTDGKIVYKKDSIIIENATKVLSITDINVYPSNNVYPEIPFYDYEKMFAEHKEKFSQKMSEFTFNVETEEINLPMEERVQRIKTGKNDDGLMLLFYNFGRYLFLSSNLNGDLPANLQGKWNRQVKPEWGSDYHFNINLQMNYWLAEPLGMGESAEKLINLIESFVPHGEKAAKDLYNCRGIWLPHAGDVWGRATPESYGYGVWIGAAGWLAQHIWHRYIYSGDVEFLENRAYPYFKKVAQFYEDYSFKDSDGIYQLSPSQSPENAFLGAGSFYVSCCKSSAIDVQIAYDALGYAIKAAEILGVDKEETEIWKGIRNNLPEFKIGSDGRLLEWNEEFAEKEPQHRHVSHLYGLYPSDLFTLEKRPKQFYAAKKSLDFRMEQGGGHTGWSRAWVACLYSRLGEGEKMYEHIYKMICEFATSSLLDTHPLPFPDQPLIFQIDGNFGAVAAMTEGVAQYKNNKLYLLPALPKRWKNGEVKGYRTPGGHTVSFKWKEETITQLNIEIGVKEELCIVLNGEERKIHGALGASIAIDNNQGGTI